MKTNAAMKTMLRSIVLWLLLIGAAIAAQSPDAVPEQQGAAPEAVVARLETALIENMKAGDSMTFDDRFASLRPLLAEIMAVERMGRYVFGRDWASFEQSQREAFSEIFLDLSAATYAGQFRKFDGESFEPVAVQRQSEDRAVVKRLLTTGSGRQIAFDYLMTRDDAHWQIVTIITDGVSDLAIKRTQYQSILDNENFDAVIAHIRKSIESQRTDPTN